MQIRRCIIFSLASLLITLPSYSAADNAPTAQQAYDHGLEYFYNLQWDDAVKNFQDSANIYFQSGNYHNASSASIMAIAAYTKYLDECREKGIQPNISDMYRQNYAFLRASAAMEGRKEISISAAHDLMENFPVKTAQLDPSLQWFMPIPYFVNARFGLWNNMLKEPAPNSKFAYATAMWHYGRGLAYVHTGNLSRATSESNELSKLAKQDSGLGETANLHIAIADNVLIAAIADKRHDGASAIDHLKTAMMIQEGLGSRQDWYFPVREALGDAYLKWGHPQDALAMYQHDLQQYPNNGWALYGMARSYRALGDKQKATQFDKQFKSAWQDADIDKPVILF